MKMNYASHVMVKVAHLSLTPTLEGEENYYPHFIAGKTIAPRG
jgi:hypothetical protein